MSSTYKRLLIVDDDANILRLLKKIFEKSYDLRISKSPSDGLKIIEEGFKPGVVLSDQIMPHMSGAEFLNVASRYVPTAVKIIMTGHTETAEIIQCVNEAKAHMYMVKPFNTIDMVQAVKLCFEHHKSIHINSSVSAYTQEMQGKQVAQSKTIADLKSKISGMRDDFVASFRVLSESQDRLSYIDQTPFVSDLVTEILNHIEFKSEVSNRIINAAKIHNAYRCLMPEHIAIKRPMMITDANQLDIWIKCFQLFVDSLRKTGLLDSTSLLLETMFENNIGTGMPNQINSSKFHSDSQVLAIAVRYTMDVYGLLPDDYEQTDREAPWEQTEGETQQRHIEAIKAIDTHRKWYSEKVIEAFSKAVEKEAFQPRKETLRIE
jgi:response regulator RpfG family c-di-GMP phosphodiesterase